MEGAFCVLVHSLCIGGGSNFTHELVIVQVGHKFDVLGQDRQYKVYRLNMDENEDCPSFALYMFFFKIFYCFPVFMKYTHIF